MQETHIAQIINDYISHIVYETIFGPSELIHWTIEDGGFRLVKETGGPSTAEDVVTFTTSRPKGFDWTNVMYDLFSRDYFGIIQEGNPFLQPNQDFSAILCRSGNWYARHLCHQARMGKIDWVIERTDGVHKGHWYARPYPLTNWMWHHATAVDYVKNYHDVTKWQICQQVLPPSSHHLLT